METDGSLGGGMRRSDYASWSDYYSDYQEKLAERFLLPFLRDAGVELTGASLLDVGCGDGGTARVFARHAARCVGLDVGEFPWKDQTNLEFRRGDILDPGVAGSLAGAFDIVVMRDVIEHIGDKALLLRHVRSSLRPGGRVLVTFPPYFSPFGAHQQSELRGSVLRLVPYVHWHPKLAHISATRMTLGGFERLAAAAGFTVLARSLYLLRPSFRLRYGLPVVRFRPAWLPLLREMLVAGAYYLLGVEDEAGE